MNLTELKELYVIELRNNPNINSDVTINSYVSAVSKFYNDNSRVYRMSSKDIKKYMAKIRTEYSDSYYNVIGSSIKILFEKVLKLPNKMLWFKTIQTRSKFVNVMTFDEFKQMMSKTDQIKHKLIVIFLYSTGVRLSEMLNLELKDIDFVNKKIFINTLKNGRNRYVQLHALLERYIMSYCKKWNPTKYLLEGSDGIKYTASSVQKIIKRLSNNKYHPHSFRHKYLTDVIEKVDVFTAKELAGHNSLKSTLHYNHIPIDRLKTLYNPLDCAMV